MLLIQSHFFLSVWIRNLKIESLDTFSFRKKTVSKFQKNTFLTLLNPTLWLYRGVAWYKLFNWVLANVANTSIALDERLTKNALHHHMILSLDFWHHSFKVQGSCFYLNVLKIFYHHTEKHIVYENTVTSQVRKYLLWSKIPRFKLGSNDPRLGMRISQWKVHND